jgi:hypothetical protein
LCHSDDSGGGVWNESGWLAHFRWEWAKSIVANGTDVMLLEGFFKRVEKLIATRDAHPAPVMMASKI